jgi:hypothetical protein
MQLVSNSSKNRPLQNIRVAEAEGDDDICVENAKDREIGERTHSEATQNQKSL